MQKIYLLTEGIQTNIYRRQAAHGAVCVYLRKPGPFRRYVSFGENCFDGTFRHAGIAIYARFRINHQHVIVEMKRFYRARYGAISITAVNARLGDDVGHAKKPPGVIELLRRII